MQPDKFTQKSQEALSSAQTKAVRLGHQEVDSEHLLAALLEQSEGLAPRLLQRIAEAGAVMFEDHGAQAPARGFAHQATGSLALAQLLLLEAA